ncbi:hypothetical protein DAI22_05g109500 [Oryza sativa Japonica Group]|nr:hypothetical protein DAI22_05g109500 [Oryza sativa Japonica Group]
MHWNKFGVHVMIAKKTDNFRLNRSMHIFLQGVLWATSLARRSKVREVPATITGMMQMTAARRRRTKRVSIMVNLF